LRAGDIDGCGRAALAAYGTPDATGEHLRAWWQRCLPATVRLVEQG